MSDQFGISKEELTKLGYTAGDIGKFKQITTIEEKLFHSSETRHHLLNPPEISEDDMLLSEATDQQNALLHAFENEAARFNMCTTIFVARTQFYIPGSIIISFAADALGLAGAASINIPILNITRNILTSNLAVNTEILKSKAEDHPLEALFVVHTLNNVGFIFGKTGDTPLAIEYYKQAWLVGNKYFLNSDESAEITTLTSVLDEYAPGFTTDIRSSCSLITKRSQFPEDDITLIIKATIQKSVLDHCLTKAWEGGFVKSGLKSYVTPGYLKKLLKTSLNDITDEHVETAQMLCFREICLANLVKTKQDSEALLANFITTYPALVLKTIIEHPEYCVDGKLIPIITAIEGGIAPDTGEAILDALTDIPIINISMKDILIAGETHTEAPDTEEKLACYLQ